MMEYYMKHNYVSNHRTVNMSLENVEAIVVHVSLRTD